MFVAFLINVVVVESQCNVLLYHFPSLLSCDHKGFFFYLEFLMRESRIPFITSQTRWSPRREHPLTQYIFCDRIKSS
ncbi:hypothetical protein DFP73DRAFT_549632 [Morchella snyderi]|nr:hypothetical protein DFP73DRAFT_549632 [Morchella snyderi]